MRLPPLMDGAVADHLDRQALTIADLRAVLAPRLDDPWANFDGDLYCFWCYQGDHAQHDPDCPVLRKDELLGR